jgi:hypothetical protein
MFPSQNRSLRLSGYQDRPANSVPFFVRAETPGSSAPSPLTAFSALRCNLGCRVACRVASSEKEPACVRKDQGQGRAIAIQRARLL